ncbi:MAG: DUF2125 domain-containing protein [Pseudomonadota bacterium]|nr:DUF2125 domain-containing protein [Pseudomonadota bacterium]
MRIGRIGGMFIGALVVVVAAWAGWWWFGATAQQTALEGWLAERRADGWAAEAEIHVSGFPNRFDMTASGLTLADPAAGWAWSAPEFRTFMLAYAPNRIIAEWPGTHRISVPGETADLSATELRASADVAPDSSLALHRGILKARELEIASGLGWTAGMEDGQLSIRDSEEVRGRANAYDGVLEIHGLRPPAAWRDLLGPKLAADLPKTLETLRLDATAVLRRPLDRAAVEAGDLRPETVVLRASELRWGPLSLDASGRLEVDEAGVPSGAIDLRAADWRRFLEAAVAAGAVPADLAGALEAGLSLMSSLTSDGRGLEAPLRFAGGRMFLGPIPLGEAPRF